MIYCSNCGKGIPDGSHFCTFCGTTVPQIQGNTATPENPGSEQSVPPQQQATNYNPTPQAQSYPPLTGYTTVAPTAKNEFFKNIGFWGAVITLVGFFLPYANGYDISFYQLVTNYASDKPEVYLYLIFPVSAAVLILQGVTGALPKFLIVIFKILPVLMLILLVIGITQESSAFSSFGSNIGTIMGNIGVGLYMTVVGTILMLFFKTTKIKV